MARRKIKIHPLLAFLMVLAPCLLVSLSFLNAQPADPLSLDGLRAAPVNPDFERHMAEKRNGSDLQTTKEGYRLGHVPSPLKLPPTFSSSTTSMDAADLPAKFDLRNVEGKSYVTPVRDQANCGSCWTFGAMGSLESYLKYKKSVNADFSEADLNENHGYSVGVCEGGNWEMSTAYMARWLGPVSEADVPYPYYQTVVSASSAPDGGSGDTLSADQAAPGVPTRYHVQNVYIMSTAGHPLKPAERTALKQAVYDNGGVDIAFYWNGSYYNSTTCAFYNTSETSQNHEVTVIGWDDGYSKTKFNTEPPGDGAFIVKNSWGKAWGKNGYFYLSYYDKSLNAGAQFLNAEATTKYTRIYQHDPLGWVSSRGYTSGTTTLAWFSNVFMASVNASQIKAISFYTPVANSTYAAFVYSDVTPGEPRSGTLVSSKTGTVVKPGYNTIPLTVGKVAPNKPFSVVVKLKTPEYDYPIPVEIAYAGYSDAASSCPGQSYVSPDGKSWASTGGYYNVCLKAFAVK